MPIHFHSHPHMNNLPPFPDLNAGTSQPQTPSHPRYRSDYDRNFQSPPQQKGSRGYYFQAPLRCRDRICHQTSPQHVHHAECEHSLYMNEQWRLAQPGKPSIMSQHSTRATLLAAKEQRCTSFMALLGFLLSLASGSGTAPEEKITPEGGGRPIGENMKELFTAIFQPLSNLLGYTVSAITRGMKRIDWNRVWKMVAFAYIAYIWGGREAKRLERLSEIVRGRERAASVVEGPTYLLVEDIRGWSTSIWDMPRK